MRAALLAVLLLPLGLAQGGAEAALAPAQTIVDAVPGIVDSAVDEARRDGSPDVAQRRAHRLLAFSTGLDGSLDIPPDSAAGRHGLASALQWAVPVAQLVAALPEDIGRMERDRAACSSEPAAQRQRVEAWLLDGRPAGQRLAAYEAGLREAAAEAPPGIDAGPLVDAAQRIELLMRSDSQEALACFAQAAQRVNVSAPDLLSLRLVPDATWPTGSVLAVGSAAAVPHLQAFARAWNATWGDGAFTARLRVPASAGIASYEVEATAGAATASAVLDVHKAPASLSLAGPARVSPGQAFTVTAVHRTPAPTLVDGSVEWSPGGDTALVGGEAARDFRFDDAGVVVIETRHAGNARLEASQASLAVVVQEPGASGTSQGRIGAGSSGLDIPWWIVLACIAAVWLVVLATRVRRPRRLRAQPAVAAGTAPPLPSGGLAAALAGFMAWLRYLGRATPGTTVREAARGEQELEPLVEPFERERYSQHAVASDRRAVPLLRRLIERLRGSP